MKTYPKKSFLIQIIILLLGILPSYSQTLVNQSWSQVTSYPNINYDFQKSCKDSKGNIIIVGNTVNSTQLENIYIAKYNGVDGTQMWFQELNGLSNLTDFGTGVTTKGEDIFVCGTMYDTSTQVSSMAIIAMDEYGSIQWQTDYQYPDYSGLNIPLAIVTNSSGSVFVTGTSQTDASEHAIVTLQIDNGSITWTSIYDSIGLYDGAGGLRYTEDAGYGRLFVYGVSGSTVSDWDFLTLKLDVKNGTPINTTRIHNSNAVFAKTTDIVYDNKQNIYATGTVSAGINNSDIKIIKLDTALNVIWVKTFDGGASKNDEATAMKVDSKGNIIVTGYATRSDNTRESWLLKLDKLGNKIWDRRCISSATNKNAQGKDVDIDNKDNIYIAGKIHNGLDYDFLTQAYDSNGNLKWQKTFKTNYSSANEAQDIIVDNISSVFVSGRSKDSLGNWRYTTVRYDEWNPSNNTRFKPNGKPDANANQLIVRFEPSALKTSTIDNKEIIFGDITDFVKDTPLIIFNNSLNGLCSNTKLTSTGNPCGIKAFKVFKQFTSTYKKAVSRLGDTIDVPEFWATLVVEFPTSININEVRNRLENIPSVVVYAHINNYAERTSGSNDSLYLNQQASLHPTSLYPNGSINIEPAWDIVPDGGSPNIRVAILDDQINWQHEDFGYDGVNPTSSKIVDGWNFNTNTALKSSNKLDSLSFHSTPVAGIIGALRNNNKGIAGIGGGNMTNGNKGVSMYNLNLFHALLGFYTLPLNDVADALVTSTIDDPYLKYGYGVHLSSNSWALVSTYKTAFLDTNFILLREAVHFVNRMKVPLVAGRGNEGQNNIAYPATMDDNWVISVGGSGTDGDYCHVDTTILHTPPNGGGNYSYGSEMDIIAPAADKLIRTTWQNGKYGDFSATSCATPHVSGVISLMLSYFNTSTPSYTNLSPEDCEHVIQLSATDVNTSGYDSLTGWGRLNAGKALNLIKKPYNSLIHKGTNGLSTYTRTKNIVSLNDTITLIERFKNKANIWFKPGKYRVNTFSISANIGHYIQANDTIIGYWERGSSSNIFPLFDSSKTLIPRERPLITNFSSSNCNMIGYVYEVKDILGNPLGWWPFDTTLSNARFEYSILTHDKSAPNLISEDIIHNNSVYIYPNPSSTCQYVQILAEKEDSYSIVLKDINGKTIKKISEGKTQIGSNTFEINLELLPEAIYFYDINIGNNRYLYKSIKL